MLVQFQLVNQRKQKGEAHRPEPESIDFQVYLLDVILPMRVPINTVNEDSAYGLVSLHSRLNSYPRARQQRSEAALPVRWRRGCKLKRLQSHDPVPETISPLTKKGSKATIRDNYGIGLAKYL